MEDGYGSDDVMERVIHVDAGQSPLRLDRYLLDRLEKVSRNKIQQGISDGIVLVNGAPTKSNYKVRPLDVITMIVTPPSPDGYHIIPEDISLDIIYEDDDLMIINKAAGIVVHPGIDNWTGTLINGVAHHLQLSSAEDLPGAHRQNPGLVHRIDKDTSGLLVVPKNDHALNELAKQFYDHSIHRRYQALVWGVPSPAEDTIDEYIGRHPKDRLRRYVFEDRDDGKRAITHYSVLDDMYYVSLIECALETGRTHQIRVHMQYRGHPLFNDPRYDGQRIHKGTVFSKYKQFVENNLKNYLPGQALHAAELGFIHPTTGEYMEFKQPLPENFQELYDRWKSYVDSRQQT